MKVTSMMKEFFQPLKVHESFNVEQHFRATYTYIATLYIAIEVLGAENFCPEKENSYMPLLSIHNVFYTIRFTCLLIECSIKELER